LEVPKALSGEATKKLSSFSGTANRGDLHPSDTKSFRAFVIQAHQDGSGLVDIEVSNFLRRYKWMEETAVKLGSQYHSCGGSPADPQSPPALSSPRKLGSFQPPSSNTLVAFLRAAARLQAILPVAA
jgi:hypothetical protein